MAARKAPGLLEMLWRRLHLLRVRNRPRARRQCGKRRAQQFTSKGPTALAPRSRKLLNPQRHAPQLLLAADHCTSAASMAMPMIANSRPILHASMVIPRRDRRSSAFCSGVRQSRMGHAIASPRQSANAAPRIHTIRCECRHSDRISARPRNQHVSRRIDIDCRQTLTGCVQGRDNVIEHSNQIG